MIKVAGIQFTDDELRGIWKRARTSWDPPDFDVDGYGRNSKEIAADLRRLGVNDFTDNDIQHIKNSTLGLPLTFNGMVDDALRAREHAVALEHHGNKQPSLKEFLNMHGFSDGAIAKMLPGEMYTNAVGLVGGLEHVYSMAKPEDYAEWFPKPHISPAKAALIAAIGAVAGGLADGSRGAGIGALIGGGGSALRDAVSLSGKRKTRERLIAQQAKDYMKAHPEYKPQ